MVIVICFTSSFSWCLLSHPSSFLGNEGWQESHKACRPKPSENSLTFTIWIGLRNPQNPCHGFETRNQHHRRNTNSGLCIHVGYPIKHRCILLDFSSIFWKILDLFIEIQDKKQFLQQSWINPHEYPIQLIIINVNGDYYCPFIHGLIQL